MWLGLSWVVTETQQTEILWISPIYIRCYCFISIVTQNCFGVFNLLPANWPIFAVSKCNWNLKVDLYFWISSIHSVWLLWVCSQGGIQSNQKQNLSFSLCYVGSNFLSVIIPVWAFCMYCHFILYSYLKAPKVTHKLICCNRMLSLVCLQNQGRRTQKSDWCNFYRNLWSPEGKMLGMSLVGRLWSGCPCLFSWSGDILNDPSLACLFCSVGWHCVMWVTTGPSMLAAINNTDQ